MYHMFVKKCYIYWSSACCSMLNKTTCIDMDFAKKTSFLTIVQDGHYKTIVWIHYFILFSIVFILIVALELAPFCFLVGYFIPTDHHQQQWAITKKKTNIKIADINIIRCLFWLWQRLHTSLAEWWYIAKPTTQIIITRETLGIFVVASSLNALPLFLSIFLCPSFVSLERALYLCVSPPSPTNYMK